MTIKASNYPTTRPSLDLNFAQTKRLGPLVTFSRSSSGTYFDANGVLQTAATNVARFDHNQSTGESLGLLVEEARTNSLTYSERLDNAAWTKSNVNVVPNSAQAPDGTYTSCLVYPSSPGTARYVYQNIGTSTSVIRTNTVYAKASGKSWMYLYGPQGSEAAFFNLATGVIGTVGSGVTASIANAGNGWYRCSVAQSAASTGRTLFVGPTDSNGSTSITPSGMDGILIWGAQLEEGSFPTSYIPTPATFTSRASSATFYDANGVIQTASTNVARSAAFFPDSNGVMRPAGLLLEAAGTNLLNGSQTFATTGGTQNNWVDANITRDGTLRTSPDGTANALRVTAAADNATIISSAAVGSSAQRTFSIFLRRVTGTGSIQYTLDNGSNWTTQAITSSWARYSFPATTADQQVGIRIVTSGDAIELWGAQLEAGSYATSYIPTTTATVTRSADVSSSATVTRSADVAQITGTNFSSWYNQSEGALLLRAKMLKDGYVVSLNGGSNANAINSQNAVVNALIVLNSSTTTAMISTRPWSSAFANVCIGIKLDDFSLVSNGSVLGSDKSSLVPVVNRLNILSAFDSTGQPGQAHISRLTYWPTRLSDATLQAITR